MHIDSYGRVGKSLPVAQNIFLGNLVADCTWLNRI